MGTKYRVDRNRSSTTAPVGMNSLRYLGDSYDEAVQVFRDSVGGKDAWDRANPEYGVTLAYWHPMHNDYVIAQAKDFPTMRAAA